MGKIPLNRERIHFFCFTIAVDGTARDSNTTSLTFCYLVVHYHCFIAGAQKCPVWPRGYLMYFNCFGGYRPDFQLVCAHASLSNESAMPIYTWWECIPVYEVLAIYCLTTDLCLIHEWKNESGTKCDSQYYMNICNAVSKIQWAELSQLLGVSLGSSKPDAYKDECLSDLLPSCGKIETLL